MCRFKGTGNLVFIPSNTQVYKSFPFHPSNGSFDPQLSFGPDDVQFLVEHGFNLVRLYVAWPGLEPTKGNYNHTYLDVSWKPQLM